MSRRYYSDVPDPLERRVKERAAKLERRKDEHLTRLGEKIANVRDERYRLLARYSAYHGGRTDAGLYYQLKSDTRSNLEKYTATDYVVQSNERRSDSRYSLRKQDIETESHFSTQIPKLAASSTNLSTYLGENYRKYRVSEPTLRITQPLVRSSAFSSPLSAVYKDALSEPTLRITGTSTSPSATNPSIELNTEPFRACKFALLSSNLSGDDVLLLHAVRETIAVWNLPCEECQLLFTGHASPVHTVVQLPTTSHLHSSIKTCPISRLVVSSSATETLLWITDTGDVLANLPGSIALATAPLRNDRGILVLIANKGMLDFHLCTIEPGQSSPKLECTLVKTIYDTIPKDISSVSIVPPARRKENFGILIGTTSGELIIINFASGESKRISHLNAQHHTVVRAIDGQLAISLIDGQLSLWDLRSLCSLHTQRVPSAANILLMIVNDGKLTPDNEDSAMILIPSRDKTSTLRCWINVADKIDIFGALEPFRCILGISGDQAIVALHPPRS